MGKLLKYFKDNGIDTHNLHYSPIYTRTLYHNPRGTKEEVISITSDGFYGSAEDINPLYIRPAFTVSNDLSVKPATDVIVGETVYVID